MIRFWNTELGRKLIVRCLKQGNKVEPNGDYLSVVFEENKGKKDKHDADYKFSHIEDFEMFVAMGREKYPKVAQAIKTILYQLNFDDKTIFNRQRAIDETNLYIIAKRFHIEGRRCLELFELDSNTNISEKFHVYYALPFILIRKSGVEINIPKIKSFYYFNGYCWQLSNIREKLNFFANCPKCDRLFGNTDRDFVYCVCGRLFSFGY